MQLRYSQFYMFQNGKTHQIMSPMNQAVGDAENDIVAYNSCSENNYSSSTHNDTINTPARRRTPRSNNLTTGGSDGSQRTTSVYSTCRGGGQLSRTKSIHSMTLESDYLEGAARQATTRVQPQTRQAIEAAPTATSIIATGGVEGPAAAEAGSHDERWMEILIFRNKVNWYSVMASRMAARKQADEFLRKKRKMLKQKGLSMEETTTEEDETNDQDRPTTVETTIRNMTTTNNETSVVTEKQDFSAELNHLSADISCVRRKKYLSEVERHIVELDNQRALLQQDVQDTKGTETHTPASRIATAMTTSRSRSTTTGVVEISHQQTSQQSTQ